MRDGAELGCCEGSVFGEQPGRDVARCRQHDAVGNDRPGWGVELVAVPGPTKCGYGRARFQSHVQALKLSDDRVDDAAEPASHAEEERPGSTPERRRGGGAVSHHEPEGAGHAAVSDESLRDLGGHDHEGQVVQPTGVDTAEQRVDQSFDELASEPSFEDRGRAPLRAARFPGAVSRRSG